MKTVYHQISEIIPQLTERQAVCLYRLAQGMLWSEEMDDLIQGMGRFIERQFDRVSLDAYLGKQD